MQCKFILVWEEERCDDESCEFYMTLEEAKKGALQHKHQGATIFEISKRHKMILPTEEISWKEVEYV